MDTGGEFSVTPKGFLVHNIRSPAKSETPAKARLSSKGDLTLPPEYAKTAQAVRRRL